MSSSGLRDREYFAHETSVDRRPLLYGAHGPRMGSLHLEHILEQTGGCGRFQVLVSFIIHSMKTIVCCSMMFMVFGAAKPDWWCDDGPPNHNVSFNKNSPSYLSCKVLNSSESCRKFRFADSMKTVVTEWNLICDKSWIPSTIVTIQLSGLLVGHLVCGPLGDLFGRKPPLFLSSLGLVVLNVSAAFSSSWIVFAVFRFFIGFMMAFELTVQYALMSEFTMANWRTWVVSVPSWAIQTSLFALIAWIFKDWRYIHFAVAATGVPMLFTFWFIPESVRWYVARDRLKQAEEVVAKIACTNRKSVPLDAFSNLRLMRDEEHGAKPIKKYTFLDLVKTKQIRKSTLLFGFMWLTIGLGTYGIQFGVPRLSGDLYGNMMVPSLIGVPLQFVIIYLQYRIGRKKTLILFYGIFVAGSLAVAIATRFQDTEHRNMAINVAALIALTAVNISWSPLQVLTIEGYPTVIRTIAFGTLSTVGRVGAILGPQLMYLDTLISGFMYWTCTVLTVLAILATLPIPESKGKDLKDKILVVDEDETELTDNC